MSAWILALIYIATPARSAEDPTWHQPFRQESCAKSTGDFLKKFGADLARANGPRTSADFSEIWDFPSAQIGQWVHLKFQYNLPSAVVAVAEGRQVGFKFEKPCLWTKVFSGPLENSRREGSFTDKDLQTLVTSKSNMMVYLWSPRQVYSMKYWQVFANVAKRFHLTFKPLIVPPITDAEWIEVRDRFQLPASFRTENGSYEVYMRGMYGHTPSSLIISKGEIKSRILVGAYTEPALMSAVEAMVK